MSRLPPISLLKSRENLQAICKSGKTMNGYSLGLLKYEVFDRVLLNIWNNIKSRLQTSMPLNYTIDLHKNTDNRNGFLYTNTDIIELIEILKKEYPGVDFTYTQTNGYDQSIVERTIIMDWS
jgi:hypothetical protein